jgi:hypothetical protein
MQAKLILLSQLSQLKLKLHNIPQRSRLRILGLMQVTLPQKSGQVS